MGLGDTLIGFLWAFAVVSEVCVFMAFTRFFGRFRATTLLMICGIAAVVRWIAYPLVWPLGLGVAGFFGVQALHGLSTGIMLIGIQKLIAETVDEERTGAAQGAAFFAAGISMAIVTLLSGSLYDRLGAVRLLRHDRRCAGRAGAGPAFGGVQPQSAGSGGDTSEPW